MFKAYLAKMPGERDEALLHCNDEELERYYMNYASLDHHYKVQVHLNDSMLVVICDKKGCNFRMYFTADNLDGDLTSAENIRLIQLRAI